MIGATESTTFTDRPPMSGVNTYTVQPVSEDGPSSVERTTSAAGQRRRDRHAGASSGPGYGLGGAMILVLLLLQSSRSVQGVDDGEAHRHPARRRRPAHGPVLGAANPNGVGEGTFDAQCGGPVTAMRT